MWKDVSDSRYVVENGNQTDYPQTSTKEIEVARATPQSVGTFLSEPNVESGILDNASVDTGPRIDISDKGGKLGLRENSCPKTSCVDGLEKSENQRPEGRTVPVDGSKIKMRQR
ncbi:hypothetical protein SUGI_0057770 [Cryptomeria japonica]|nr:hypothetical protein SUGI_0057770 [Cryptomeria japonica]